MKLAALCFEGRIVTGRSHLDAFEQLDIRAKNSDAITSGFFDDRTGEFISDLEVNHFYDKTILLIRHGRTLDQGYDSPLSGMGIEGIQNLKKLLKNFDLHDFVGFSSPLLRCLETAEIIGDAFPIGFEVKKALREIGNFLDEDEDFVVENRHEKFPQFKWEDNDDFLMKYESIDDFVMRVATVLQNLPPKSILVSHCDFIMTIAKLALCDQKVFQYGVPNASLTLIDKQVIKCLDSSP